MEKFSKDADRILRTVDNGQAPCTIEESLAHSIVNMEAAELRALARRAFGRGYREALRLIQAEFRRRQRVSQPEHVAA